MSQWRRQSGVTKQLNRQPGCRYCPTSGVVKKIHDTMSRVKQHFQDLWSRRKKSK
jgi:hypothetical protein